MSTDAVEIPTPPASLSLRRSAIAVGALFFVNGMTFSNWLPRLPEIRDRLGISNGGLGTALLGGGLGGLVASAIVAPLLRRLGSRRLLLIAAPLGALLFPLIAHVPNAFVFLVLLSCLGCVDVLNDMAMNAQGSIVQNMLGRSIMNRLHGAWSAGFTVGALIGTLASALGIDLAWQLVIVALLLLATIAWVRSSLIIADPVSTAAGDAQPRRRSRRLGASFVAMLLLAFGLIPFEVLPGDWSAIALRDLFAAGDLVGAGTVLFSAGMLVGRLFGDRLLDSFGSKRLLSGALATIALGVAVVLTSASTAQALIGFTIWGLGASVVMPQLYTLAADLPGAAPGAGFAALSFGHRVGGLITPLAVGWLSEADDIRFAFLVVTVISMLLVLVNRHRLEAAEAQRAATAEPTS